MASVDAVAHPVDGERRLLLHLPLPQKALLDEDLLLSDAPFPKRQSLTRICSFRMRMTMSSARTAMPQASGCSLQECPRSPLFVPTTSAMMPEGCVGGGGSWGGGFFFAAAVFLDSLLGFEAMATEAGTGNAGCFAHTAEPHILHSTTAYLFST